MNANDLIREKIYNHLIETGCNQSVANQAADKGVEFFNQGNHKDPYFDSLCHAGVIWAENLDKNYKFKKPKKVGGRAFSYGKPKSRKHNKQNDALF